MRHTVVLALAAGLLGLGLGSAPGLAAPRVVGYLPPKVDYGALTDETDETGELAADELRARGLVVANLELTDPDTDADAEEQPCPPQGCTYQLIVTDPAEVRPARREVAAPSEAAPSCGAGSYGVVDADPDHRAVNGARLFTAQGSLPARTADTVATYPEPLTPGVAQLCFAAFPDDESGGSPPAITQPVPIVILSTGGGSGRD